MYEASVVGLETVLDVRKMNGAVQDMYVYMYSKRLLWERAVIFSSSLSLSPASSKKIPI